MENIFSEEYITPFIFGVIIILIILVRYFRKRRLKKQYG